MTATPTTGRSRRRRNVIGSSAQRETYVRLIKAGWTSEALERYAMHRYREDIPASTFREFKAKHRLELEVEDPMYTPISDAVMDVLAERGRAIVMQKERIGIDLTHERSMRKLFANGRGEIQLLNQLLDAYKGDLQDLGLMPKAGDVVTINSPVLHEEDPGDAPPARGALAQMVGEDLVAQAEMARVIHMAEKRATGGSGSAVGG